MSASKMTVTGAAEIIVQGGAFQGRIRMRTYDIVPAEIRFALEHCPAQSVA